MGRAFLYLVFGFGFGATLTGFVVFGFIGLYTGTPD